jgi:putative nucleotidyltransferase with HDIG domain
MALFNKNPANSPVESNKKNTLKEAKRKKQAEEVFNSSTIATAQSTTHTFTSSANTANSRPPETHHAILRPNWRQLGSVGLFSLICVAAISFIFLWRFDSNVVARQSTGEVALANLLAPKSHSYISAVKTKELADAAANNPANQVYKRDTTIVSQQRENLSRLLNNLTNARASSDALHNLNALMNDPAVQAANLSMRDLTNILNFPDSTWNQIVQEAKSAYSVIMVRDINQGDLANFANILRDAVYVPYTLSAGFAQLDEVNRELTVNLVKPFIKVNTVLDDAATKKKQADARAGVGPATVDIVKGTAIVRQGDVLTALDLEKLKELGLLTSSYNISQVVGTVGITSFLILLLVYYTSLFSVQIWANPRWVMLLGAALIASSLAMRILIIDAGKDSYRAYLVPLAVVVMLFAALLDIQLALFLAAILALFTGLVSGQPELVAVYFAGSAMGALTIRKAENTLVFAYAGLAVAGSQFVVGLAGILLNRTLDTANLPLLLAFSAFNGLISASLAFLSFAVLGKLFGVATVLQLLELAHPNQPLLRRLIREAPGTYHHSVMVSNLAEQAAEHVSDNALLARVGAYYHDIGKLTRPTYFIDNQAGGANIHDSLDPRESARLIKAHVSDGVALARKHNLPRKVVDIIHQHHGTCAISFFYQKALKMGLDVNEIDFHYPGPKPQTKVAAIVMMADGCEAAVRANVQSGRILTGNRSAVPGAPNPDSGNGAKPLTIRDVVNKIIDDRIKENQLSECDLTLRDIDDIRDLFVDILNGIYHPRISYPDKETGPAPANQPPVSQPETTVVATNIREIPVSLVKFEHNSGAADGGSTHLAEIVPFTALKVQDSPNESLLGKPDPTRGDKNQGNPKSGIGGAGKRISGGS